MSCLGISVPEPDKATEGAWVGETWISESSQVFIHQINSTDIY